MSRKATKKDLTGWEWRRVKRRGNQVLQRRRKQNILGSYETFEPEDLIDKANASDWEEITFELDSYTEYGETYAAIYMHGWSDATDEEVAKALSKIQESLDRRDEHDRQEIERLRKARPELFKDTS